MEEIKFLEKQYLGLNKMSFFRRMALAIFCFVAYYWSENHEKSGELFWPLSTITFELYRIRISSIVR